VSYSLDVNVLLYASDHASDRHQRARQFLESCAAGPELLCLTWPTLMSYLRIATHPRIFSAPLSPDDALGNISALIELPHVRTVSELDNFIDAYRRVASDIPFAGTSFRTLTSQLSCSSTALGRCTPTIVISGNSQLSRCETPSPEPARRVAGGVASRSLNRPASRRSCRQRARRRC
jgi:uncharacterized protein